MLITTPKRFCNAVLAADDGSGAVHLAADRRVGRTMQDFTTIIEAISQPG